MKAMLTRPDRSLSWAEVPDPVLKPDCALVRIHAAALNRADILQRAGKYPSPPDCPEWMGLEVSGVITALGDVARTESRWQVGDKVCALLGGGGYAEQVSVRHDMLMPIPEGLSFEEAAALPEAYATSYLNLFMEGGLKRGNTAYIPAGASGLASVAIPMAKAFGARVITSVLTADVAARIEHLGADRVIVSETEEAADVLRAEQAASHPVDVAMDCLGGDALGACLPFMAEGGRWILISTLAGETTQLPLRALLTKGIRLSGSMLRKRSSDEKAGILAQLVEDVWPLITAGHIRPSIYKVLPIGQAEEAHAILESGRHVGKIVLKVR